MIRILLAFFFCLHLVEVFSQIRLPKLISDGAVLQRNVELKFWGWASPNEKVDLALNNKVYSTSADVQGNWQLILPPQEAGGPYIMTFKGKNEIIIENILFGEVWLCSGQSNMELTMHRVKDKYPDVIKNCKNPNIRQFVVPDQYDFNTEHTDLESGNWVETDPESILGFSAVAYFFAKEIYNKYQVPVGLINAALGGSPVEAWMSEDALEAFPYAYEELQKFKDSNLIEEIQKRDRERQNDWYDQLNQKDKGLSNGAEWYLANMDDEGWEEMLVPDFWSNQGLNNTNGVVWFRKKITIPKKMIGKEAKLWLGRIVDQDYVYVNGNLVGTTGYQYPPRKYTIDPIILKEGVNTIAIRVINQQGKGGFILDKPYFLAVENDTLNLKGIWKYQLGAGMEPLESQTFIRWKPGGLYKKMIAPLLNYHIKGVIWYQGESNTKNPEQYYDLFPALIKNWRAKWKIGDFPFLYVQLANFMEERNQPMESQWAELRQAQLSALSISNTGMAVTIDLGEWNDIHPLNKRDVGKRLALHAFQLAYNDKSVIASGPIPTSHKFNKTRAKIKFKNTGGGLMTKNGKSLAYFELSADGKKYVKADAKIKGNIVIISSDGVRNPVAVRYAWADNPGNANLYSIAGLPASPFQIEISKEK